MLDVPRLHTPYTQSLGIPQTARFLVVTLTARRLFCNVLWLYLRAAARRAG